MEFRRESLSARAYRLQEAGIFLGSPPQHFDVGGRKQLITLLNEGLIPDSMVLDIGCGCLRGGYWLIHFLQPGYYCGIEPNREMLDSGLNILLEPETLALKRPRFDYNMNFDASVFEEQFDYFVARSIWTHASKSQIGSMLDAFCDHSSKDAIFLASYRRASALKFRRDYKGTQWIGRSHESDQSGMVAHKYSWIRSECERRKLTIREIKGSAYNFGNQVWLRIARNTR